MTQEISDINVEALAAQLDADRVMAQATEDTGLDDFGSVVEPLRVLVDSVKAEGQFNAVGYYSMSADLNRWLTNWLRFRDDVTRHPEILEEDVSDPVVIVGLPRTGTTKLQRVLSRHQHTHKLYLWKALNPARPLEASADGRDPRIGIAEGFMDAMISNFPDFPTMHPMAAEEPEECVFLMQHGLETPVNAMLLRAPSYLDWLMHTRGYQQAYQNLHQLLQYLQWQDGGRRGPWVLKTPLHLGRMDALVAAFPRATVVHIHRDLNVSMASLCRIMEAARTIRTDPEEIDLLELGQFLVKFWSEEWRLNLQQREAIPADQILDVQYDAVKDDSVAVACEVFGSTGMELTEQDVEAMAGWQNQNPQHKFGKIEYSLERYGLTPDDIAKAFTEYFDRFGSQ